MQHEKEADVRVLVTAASRHGATIEIAQEIGRVLREAGLGVDVEPIEDIEGVARYDGVIVGSAVYVGRWLPAAVDFVKAHRAELAERPVWLFSSGPIGSPEPKPTTPPQDVADLAASIEARDHSIFPGKIDRNRLSFGERTIVRVVRAPEGDYREWATIDAWAADIAGQLTGQTSAQPVEAPA